MLLVETVCKSVSFIHTVLIFSHASMKFVCEMSINKQKKDTTMNGPAIQTQTKRNKNLEVPVLHSNGIVRDR